MSFHLGVHYNSVRSVNDPQYGGEPATKYNTTKGFDDLCVDEEEKVALEESKQIYAAEANVHEVQNLDGNPSREELAQYCC